MLAVAHASNLSYLDTESRRITVQGQLVKRTFARPHLNGKKAEVWGQKRVKLVKVGSIKYHGPGLPGKNSGTLSPK
jgi:hypothetical protein